MYTYGDISIFHYAADSSGSGSFSLRAPIWRVVGSKTSRIRIAATRTKVSVLIPEMNKFSHQSACLQKHHRYGCTETEHECQSSFFTAII